MAKNGFSLNLPSADSLFSTQAERDKDSQERVTELPIAEIEDFADHPFKVQYDEAMQEMAESIKKYGVLIPVLVRPKESGGYEAVSGHRRKYASLIAEKERIPAIVRSMTDDEAIIVMVDSNLQREKLLPSEKAFAYKMKLDAMKRQGKRTDLTSRPLGEKLFSVDAVSKDATDSSRQIHRYIRLTELIPELLQMVDENKVAFRPAVELSYLPKDNQLALHDAMLREDCTPSLVQALKMKEFSQNGRLDENVILSILSEAKPNQVEQFKMPQDRIRKFFTPGTPAKKMEDTIVKALELYRKREQNRER